MQCCRIFRALASLACLAASPVASTQSINSISPDLIRPLTTVDVRVSGSRFTSAHRVAFRSRADGRTVSVLLDASLEDCQIRQCRTITGTTARMAAGRYDVLILADRNVVIDVLDDGFEVLDPARVTSVSPFEIPRAGGVEMTIVGERFRDASLIFLGAYELRDTRVSGNGTRITGTAPPIEAADPGGLFSVRVIDSRGEGTPLRSGVLYRDPDPVEVTILAVDPPLLSTAGGRLVVQTRGALETDVLTLGGVDLAATFARGTFSANVRRMDPGFYPLSIQRDRMFLDTFEVPVEVAAPPRIAFVDPVEVCAAGGTVLRIHGEGMRSGMSIFVGGVLLEVIAGAETGVSICAEVPSLPSGVLDVVLSDARGRVVMENAVTSIDGCSTTPGPQQIELSLAEGTARFTWHNPRRYRGIRIESLDGQLIQSLPGDATTVSIQAEGDDCVDVCIRAVDSDGLFSKPSFAAALQGNCERPPPLNFVGKPGELDMSLRGGHAPATVDRCDIDTAPVAKRFLGPKSYQISKLAIGTVTPAVYLQTLPAFQRDMLTTGFTLDEDADAIEIFGLYQKIATDAGVELRARITKVFPEEGRFTDEVTFPDILLDSPKEWNCITYFRGDRDVSDPLVNRCPDPDAPGENLKLTAGEYLLDYYVVGGDSKTAYFLFADDAYDFELLIPGAPCGPYPATKVVDFIGLRTLPVVTEVLSKPERSATKCATLSK